jgi:hypothetical protein
VRYGRPNWDEEFARAARKHCGERIGVFFCGPSMLANLLRDKCHDQNASARRSGDDKTTFDFNQEIF